MLKQCYLCFGLVLLMLLLTSCSKSTDSNAAGHTMPPTAIAVGQHQASRASFSLMGALKQQYQLQSTTTISKLRHGHKEFTINIVDAAHSLIIVFYGYSGPGSYTLTNRSNGGDVRITVDKQYWDLSLLATLSCSLIIQSDEPTTTPGMDHMRGNFSCPSLPAGHLNRSRQSVALTDGQFDILIIVES